MHQILRTQDRGQNEGGTETEKGKQAVIVKKSRFTRGWVDSVTRRFELTAKLRTETA